MVLLTSGIAIIRQTIKDIMKFYLIYDKIDFDEISNREIQHYMINIILCKEIQKEIFKIFNNLKLLEIH